MNDDSFFSINRLVEFGMGMAVAQQMVKTMNEAMNSMHVPGTMNPMQSESPQAPPQFYYVILEEKQAGPFSEPELTRLISDGKVMKETYVWKPGMTNWEFAEKLPEILKLVALAPPPFIQQP